MRGSCPTGRVRRTVPSGSASTIPSSQIRVPQTVSATRFPVRRDARALFVPTRISMEESRQIEGDDDLPANRRSPALVVLVSARWALASADENYADVRGVELDGASPPQAAVGSASASVFPTWDAAVLQRPFARSSDRAGVVHRRRHGTGGRRRLLPGRTNTIWKTGRCSKPRCIHRMQSEMLQKTILPCWKPCGFWD